MSKPGNGPAIWSKGPFSLYKRSLKVSGDTQATASQMAGAARDILTFRDSGMWGIGDLCVYAEQIGKEDAVDTVADELVRDRQSVRKAFYVSKAIGVDQRVYDLWWSFYFAVYTFPEDVRARLLALAEREKMTLDEFKKHLRDLRHTVRKEQQDFPEGTYGLIYADPPWKYDNSSDSVNGAADKQYPTLTVEEIRDLSDPRGRGVSDLASPASILYMWTTNAFLSDALGVAAAWGFEYKSNHVWVKDLQGTGFWTRARHELLLICTKGDVIPPHESIRPDSVIQEPARGHSQKPESVYEMLEKLYADMPRIELFAREKREGWDLWGNQSPEEAAAMEADAADVPEPDPETGDVPEAGAEQEARDGEAAREPKERVSESASTEKAGKKKRVRDRSKAGLAAKAEARAKNSQKPAPRLNKGAKKEAATAVH